MRIRAETLDEVRFRERDNPATRAQKMELVRAGVVSLAAAVEEIGESPGTGGYTYATTATSYTEAATSGEKIVEVSASGQTIILPSAVGNTAKLTFKLMVAGTLTLDGAGSETIDGGSTAVLTVQYQSVTLYSNNANWLVG